MSDVPNAPITPPRPTEFLGHASEFEPDEVPNRLMRFGLWMLVALLAVAACSNALGLGWIGDDQKRLDTDMRLRSDVGIAYTWRHPFTGVDLPLGETLLNLQYQHLTPAHPTRWHAAALAMLLAAGASLALLLRRLGVPIAGWLVALLLVHPIATTSIARLDAFPLLCSIATFGLAWLAFRHLTDPLPLDLDSLAPTSVRWIYHPVLIGTAMIVLAAVSLLAHPVAALCAIIAIVAEGLLPNRNQPLTRRAWMWLVSFTIAALAVCTAWQLNRPSHTSASILTAIAVAPRVVWSVLWQLLAPNAVPLDVVTTQPWSFSILLAFVAWLSLGVIAWLSRRRFGVIAMLFWISIALSAVFAVAVSEVCESEIVVVKVSQLPAALLMLLAIGTGVLFAAQRLAKGIPSHWLKGLAPQALAGLSLLGLATRSWFAGAALANEPALLAAAADAHPTSLAVAVAHADALLRANTDDVPAAIAPVRAAEAYDRILAIHPDSQIARIGLAACLAKQQRFDEAIELYRQAVTAAPDDAQLYIGESQLYAAKGVGPQAMRLSRRALELQPNNPVAHHDLALQLDIAGELDEAAIHYGTAMRLDPLFCPPRVNLATLWFRQGKVVEASEMLLSATRIDPMDFDAYANAGAMLATLEQWPRAEGMLRAALSLKHDAKDVWRNLAIVLDKEGKTREAQFARDRAATLAK